MATGGGPVGPLEAIVLAGGSGSRFGGAKLTAPWRGAPLIDGALTAAFAAPVRSVTVVTGADRAVDPATRAFAANIDRTRMLRMIHAADHALGISATLRAGVEGLPADTGAAFVFLGDMPRIPSAILPALAAALAAGALAAAPAFRGRRGHPVLFHRSLFASVLGLTGDVGARSRLDELGDNLALVETPDHGVLFDVDFPTGLDQG